jgi:hypothetical protein
MKHCLPLLATSFLLLLSKTAIAQTNFDVEVQRQDKAFEQVSEASRQALKYDLHYFKISPKEYRTRQLEVAIEHQINILTDDSDAGTEFFRAVINKKMLPFYLLGYNKLPEQCEAENLSQLSLNCLPMEKLGEDVLQTSHILLIRSAKIHSDAETFKKEWLFENGPVGRFLRGGN